MSFPIYVINLDRSPDRWQYMTDQFARLGLEAQRVAAVDAQTLGDLPRDVFDPELARRSYFAPVHGGEIACFLSHRLAWEAFLNGSDAPFCAILEDDCALPDEFGQVITAIGQRDDIAWDMIKLFVRRERRFREMATIDDRFALVRYGLEPTGTVGQLLTRAGAQKLLDGTLPIRWPIDVQIQNWWDIDLDLLSLRPGLVRERDRSVHDSVLGTVAKEDRDPAVMREFKRLGFRVSLFLRSHFNNLRR